MYCKDCGGSMIGDGYNSYLRCEFSNQDEEKEPDSEIVYCGYKEEIFNYEYVNNLHIKNVIDKDLKGKYAAKRVFV